MGVAIKFLAFLLLACAAIAIVVIIFWKLGKYIRDEYLTDRAETRREIEELENLYNKFEEGN